MLSKTRSTIALVALLVAAVGAAATASPVSDETPTIEVESQSRDRVAVVAMQDGRAVSRTLRLETNETETAQLRDYRPGVPVAVRVRLTGGETYTIAPVRLPVDVAKLVVTVGARPHLSTAVPR